MTHRFILAYALEKSVNQAINELLHEQPDFRRATLVSTIGVRHPELDKYHDIPAERLTERLNFNFPKDSRVIIIQQTLDLSSCVDIYRFIRANGVNQFSIKVAGKDLLPTSVEAIFSSFSTTGKGDEPEQIRVSPHIIHRHFIFAPAYYGSSQGGDWDTDNKAEGEAEAYSDCLANHFKRDKPWSETLFYRDTLSRLHKGESRFGCGTEAQLDRYCSNLDCLYSDIKRTGEMPQPSATYEIAVNIGRSGQFILNHGSFPLAIAKLAGLTSIPVRVAVRHHHWVEFKKELLVCAEKFFHGVVPAKLNHPDLQHIPHSRDSQRLNCIVRNLLPDARTVLDIGSQWGYFCQELEDAGYRCTAVEADTNNFYFLNKLKLAQGHQFELVNASIFDFVQQKLPVDVILALDIFHYFFRKEATTRDLKELLPRLQTKEMFLQTHSVDDPLMRGAYFNPGPDQFVDFVLTHSHLSSSVLIADVGADRRLYHLRG